MLENKRDAGAPEVQRSGPERGVSIVEYALLIGFIATIGIIAMRALGSSMSSQFSSTAGTLQG